MATFRLYTHVSFVSIQVHVVGGTDQGVAQLQKEFFQEFATQIPPVEIFLGYTVIKGVGWTITGWDSLFSPLYLWMDIDGPSYMGL